MRDLKMPRSWVGRVPVLLCLGLLACGDSVDLGSNGSNGPSEPAGTRTVEILADQQYVTSALAVDETHVYWANSGRRSNGFDDGTVQRIPKAGGPTELLGTALEGPSALALDATHVYWMQDNGLLRVPKSGGTPEARGYSGGGIAVDDGSVYWTDDAKVQRAAKATLETPADIAVQQQNAHDLVVDATHVYWASQGRFDASQASLYVDGSISRALKGGGPTEVLAAQQHGATSVTLHDGRLYWITEGRIAWMENAPGAPVSQVPGVSDAVAFLLLGDTLYWTDRFQIVRQKLSGEGAEQIAKEARIFFLASDGSHLYFATQGGLDAPDSTVFVTQL